MRLQNAGVTLSEAIVFLAPNTAKLITGHDDWLIALRYQVKQPIERCECEDSNQVMYCDKSIKERQVGRRALSRRQTSSRNPAKLFNRKGRVKNYEIKIGIKEIARTTQQKGRRIPMQLQYQVDADIQKLLKDGHFVPQQHMR